MDDFEINLGSEFERQLTCIQEVNVFKIPALKQADGYRCTGWEGGHLWTGRLRVLVKGKTSRIVLDDPNTLAVFAECPLDHPNAVERVIDSSRYFVLRIVNGTKHAFIGMGMKERNHAFDFNVALEEAKKTGKEFEERQQTPQNAPPPEIKSSGNDYSLQPGQKITINLTSTNTRKKRNVEGNGLKL